MPDVFCSYLGRSWFKCLRISIQIELIFLLCYMWNRIKTVIKSSKWVLHCIFQFSIANSSLQSKVSDDDPISVSSRMSRRRRAKHFRLIEFKFNACNKHTILLILAFNVFSTGVFQWNGQYKYIFLYGYVASSVFFPFMNLLLRFKYSSQFNHPSLPFNYTPNDFLRSYPFVQKLPVFPD